MPLSYSYITEHEMNVQSGKASYTYIHEYTPQVHTIRTSAIIFFQFESPAISAIKVRL